MKQNTNVWKLFETKAYRKFESGFYYGTELIDLLPNENGKNTIFKFMNKNLDEFLLSLWESCFKKYKYLNRINNFIKFRKTSLCLWDSMLKAYNLYSIFDEQVKKN